MNTIIPASDYAATTTATRPKTPEEIEAIVRERVRDHLDELRAQPIPKEYEQCRICGWKIPAGLEEDMVAYGIETYGMSIAEIAEYYGKVPFEGLLEPIETNGPFKILALDLHEVINPGLHFNLWLHIVKDLHKLKEGVDYDFQEQYSKWSPDPEIAFTMNAAIEIIMDTNTAEACVVQEQCAIGPGPAFGVLPEFSNLSH